VNIITSTTRNENVGRTKRTSQTARRVGAGSCVQVLAAVALGIGVLVLTGCSVERRVDKHVRRGDIYIRSQQLTRAAEEFEKALDLDPDNITAHYKLGATRAAQNDQTAAIAEFERVVELAPQHRGAYEGLGTAYVARQDYAALLRLADTLNELELFGGLAENYRGIVARENGDVAAAAEAFSEATRKEPQLVEAWLNLVSLHYEHNDYAAAESACRAAIAHLGSREHSIQTVLAKALERQGKPDEAIAVLLEDIEHHPDQIGSRARLGELYLRTNQIDKLRDLGTAILKRNSRSPFAKYFIGVADLTEGNYHKSVEQLAAVVTTAPELPGPHLYLALAQEQTGAVQQAITHVRQYLDAMPDSVQARVVLARLYNRAGWIEEAREIIEEASALDPANMDVLAVRGSIALGERDYTAASREFQSMLDQAPENIRAKLSLAMVALGKKEPDAAISFAQNVVGTNPDDPRSYNVLGLAYIQKGDLREAVVKFAKARTVRPDFVAARRNLARIYAGLGRFDAAEAEYTAILRTRPDDRSTRMALAYLTLARGDFTRAAKSFRGILSLDPDDVGTRVALATALAHADAEDEAIGVLSGRFGDSEQAPRMYSTVGRIELRRKAYDRATAAYTRAIELDPEMIDAYIDLGMALMMAGRAAEGADRIADARAKAPTASRPLMHEIAARLVAGQTNKALALLDRSYASAGPNRTLDVIGPMVYLAAGNAAAARNAVETVGSRSTKTDLIELINHCETFPERGVTWIPASLALLDRGLLPAALDAANIAVEQLSEVCIPYLVRASIELRLDDVDAALDDFQTVLSLRPGHPAALDQAVKAHVRLGQSDAALALLEDAIEREPGNVQWLTRSGSIYLHSGNNEKARAMFERVLKLESDNAEAANNLAYVYLADGQRLADALRLAEQAVRARPDDGDVLDTLGWAYLNNGRLDEAVRTLETAVALRPANPTVLYHYGEALDRAGHRDRALAMWRATFELGKDFPEAGTVRAALAEQKVDRPG